MNKTKCILADWNEDAIVPYCQAGYTSCELLSCPAYTPENEIDIQEKENIVNKVEV